MLKGLELHPWEILAGVAIGANVGVVILAWVLAASKQPPPPPPPQDEEEPSPD